MKARGTGRVGRCGAMRLPHYLLLLAVLLSLLAIPSSSVTQSAILGTPPSASAAGSVTVTNTSAKAHFPTGIAFHLEASAASGEITGVNLLYHAVGTLTTKRIPVAVERGQRITLEYTADMQNYLL